MDSLDRSISFILIERTNKIYYLLYQHNIVYLKVENNLGNKNRECPNKIAGEIIAIELDVKLESFTLFVIVKDKNF